MMTIKKRLEVGKHNALTRKERERGLLTTNKWLKRKHLEFVDERGESRADGFSLDIKYYGFSLHIKHENMP